MPASTTSGAPTRISAERKSFSVVPEFKNTDDANDFGSVSAVIATLNVVDREGDIIKRGAFLTSDAPVSLSAWNHDSVPGSGNEMPVGTGYIREKRIDGKYRAVFTGTYFPDPGSQAVRQRHVAMAEADYLTEWSFSFIIGESQMAARRGKEVREIYDLKAIEASPVGYAAGVETTTIAAKDAGTVYIDEQGNQWHITSASSTGNAQPATFVPPVEESKSDMIRFMNFQRSQGGAI